ncbi:MAG TPA: hypothetical protein K8V11_10155 [Dietzia timorensis]|uniref:Uncharacterized protein n=1 Tax=Dietzia timorensis TaxID=499555 RepID=A0A921F507_9ACTN|nr:hypothetical protein [Dietzia timorensis]HJE91357.1 hypothetical protein [Dietzia timorensis]
MLTTSACLVEARDVFCSVFICSSATFESGVNLVLARPFGERGSLSGAPSSEKQVEKSIIGRVNGIRPLPLTEGVQKAVDAVFVKPVAI